MSELRGRIQSVIETEPVALFMKGTPQFVMCGNSERALQALRNAGAPVTAVDVLPDPEIRQELSALSGWPTIPQVFIRGELVGGADIVEELAASGELEEKLGGLARRRLPRRSRNAHRLGSRAGLADASSRRLAGRAAGVAAVRARRRAAPRRARRRRGRALPGRRRTLSRLPGGTVALYATLLALVAGVTAVLNLDTAALFLTPVLVQAARSRGVEERAFLYGAVFMSNSASLILPGANLTNLIVLSREHVTGATFAARIWPAWAAAVIVTGVMVAVLLKLRRDGQPSGERPRWRARPRRRRDRGRGGARARAAAPRGARPRARHRARPLKRAPARDVLRTVSPLVLASLFAVAVALGTLGRAWEWPARLANEHGRWVPALVAATGSVLVNNLPASVLLSAQPPLHPRALLVGLDLGPNLFVTGSLSVFLWWRAAKLVGAQPSIATYARVGVVVAPLSIVAALAALRLAGGPWF